MSKTKWACTAACLAVFTLQTGPLFAIEVTPLSGDYDNWIRQSAPGTNYNPDALSVWTTEGPANTARYAVVQFDLSSVNVPITSAYLELAPYSSTQTVTMAPAFWVDGSIQPGDVSTLTWSDYEIFIQPYQTQFETLGSGTFDHLPAGVYTQTSFASAADIAALEGIRNDGVGHLITMIFTPVSGKADFNSADYNNEPWKLLINASLPVAGDLNGDFQVDMNDYGILTSNWMLPVTPGTDGDLNGDGTVDLTDFVQFKQDYIAYNGPASASALTAVPEPATLTLLGAMLPAWLLVRRKAKALILDKK
jgi:hypothetical protein